jgi:hypothetical protein
MVAGMYLSSRCRLRVTGLIVPADAADIVRLA